MRYAGAFGDIGSIGASKVSLSTGMDTGLAEGSTESQIKEMYKNGEIDAEQYIELLETLDSSADSYTTAL